MSEMRRDRCQMQGSGGYGNRDSGRRTGSRAVQGRGQSSGRRPGDTKTQYREDQNARFINPYNFIPLGEECFRVPDTGKENTPLYTGYLECTLQTLTPLFIPNTSSCDRLLTERERKNSDPKKEGKGYDFFSYEDYGEERISYQEACEKAPRQPVVPGSEIRGMVRSVFEAAFHGCMTTVPEGKMPVRKNDVLREEDVFGKKNTRGKEAQNRHQEGKEEVARYTYYEWLAQYGGFQPCDGKELCSACRLFGMVGKTENAYARGAKLRFGDAVLTGECAQMAGKVQKLFEQPVLLSELGQPNPETTEFYTWPPSCAEGEAESEKESGNPYEQWSYYGRKTRQKGRGTENSSGSGIQACSAAWIPYQSAQERPVPRGRKYYWHTEPELRNEYKAEGMRQRIRPLKRNVCFAFRIYLEDVSAQQIANLKWALDFGDSERYAHKLGHGKPLGFGSVRIKAERLMIRTIHPESGEWKLEIKELGESAETGFLPHPEIVESDQSISALLKMADWENKPEHVSYPIGYKKAATNDGLQSFQWFNANKEMVPEKFHKILPSVEVEMGDPENEENQKKVLYKLIRRGEKNGY